jgi:hypothetical protein
MENQPVQPVQPVQQPYDQACKELADNDYFDI